MTTTLKFAVRTADEAAYYGPYVSRKNFILFDTASERDAFMKEYGSSGRVFVDPAKDKMDPMDLLPESEQIALLKQQLAEKK